MLTRMCYNDTENADPEEKTMREEKNSPVRSGRVQIPFEREKKLPGAGDWVFSGIMLLLFWPLGAWMLYKNCARVWRRRKNAHYRSYAAIIGNRYEVDIREMAARMGKTASLVMIDLQSMIDRGYLGENAYIDRSRGALILDAIQTEFVDEEETSGQDEERLGAENAGPTVDPQNTEDEFGKKLREIRALNEQIDDEGVSRRVDRIGALTASIFSVMRENPGREDEIRKFMNYYLPTTFRLLKSYALMEKQSYQGERIAGSRRKIEGILDTLIKAFEQQQDKLFTAEALDVEADIEVLETMMAKDGLVMPEGADFRAAPDGKRNSASRSSPGCQ